MIKVINILLLIIVAVIVLACANPHKEQTKNESTIQNIPNIVKALEALGNTGKKKVDKEEKK